MFTAPTIKEAYTKSQTQGDVIHRKIMQSFRSYMVVGGMLQAVQAFVSGKSFDLFAKKHPIKLEDKFIIYAKDFKYEEGILYIPPYMTMCL